MVIPFVHREQQTGHEPPQNVLIYSQVPKLVHLPLQQVAAFSLQPWPLTVQHFPLIQFSVVPPLQGTVKP
jgi:hypothetical protein